MMTCRKAVAAVIAIATGLASTAILAHEMFLKAQDSFVTANSDQVVRPIRRPFPAKPGLPNAAHAAPEFGLFTIIRVR